MSFGKKIYLHWTNYESNSIASDFLQNTFPENFTSHPLLTFLCIVSWLTSYTCSFPKAATENIIPFWEQTFTSILHWFLHIYIFDLQRQFSKLPNNSYNQCVTWWYTPGSVMFSNWSSQMTETKTLEDFLFRDNNVIESTCAVLL